MKKILLYLWNLLLSVRKQCIEAFFTVRDFFYRRLSKPPTVTSPEETLRYIIEHKCSVSRFGDGEIKLVAGKDISFQKNSPFIQKKMQETLSSDEPGHIVCTVEFHPSPRYMDGTNAYWTQHFTRYRRIWYKYMHKGKTYHNASVTRQYIALRDKSGCAEWFREFRKIWDGRDIVFIEGENSRLGVGNDLFDNAKSVRRILGPSSQGFSKYRELLEEAEKLDKDCLILLALGPVASVLALDLHRLGYQAIDVGHVDVEYEWFRMGATQKMPIPHKMVHEARTHREDFSLDEKDPYHQQIIANVCDPR